MNLKCEKKGNALVRLVGCFVGLLIFLVLAVVTFVFQIRQSFPSDYYSLVVENLRVLVLVALTIVVFSYVAGGVRWWRCVVQLVHMCVFLGSSSFFYFIMPHQSYSRFLNGVQDGVYSLNELWFIYLLMSVLVPMQIALSDLEYFERVVQRVTYGFYALTAVLLPSVIGSYNLIQAYLTIECNPEYVAEREWCNMIFSMVVGSMILYAFSSSFRVFVPKLCKFLGVEAYVQDAAVPARAEEVLVSVTVSQDSSSASYGDADGQADLRWSVEELRSTATGSSSSISHRSADHVAMPSRLEEPRSSSSVSVGSSSGLGGAVSKQLMSAAVSGLVAGACFSVVSSLFCRRCTELPRVSIGESRHISILILVAQWCYTI